ncbi:MAG: UTRA domain-containing protein, partial [Dethiobacteria bacterium]|nr:UTRA domain-containing protein [Dethiobacteria bacterium]
IYSIQGKGNYVKAHDLTKYTILFDEMKNPINSVDKTRLLGVNIIKPDQRMIDNLQISQYKKVIEIRRLFYTEGQPVAYDLKYLLYQRGMPIVEKEIQYATFPEMIAKSVSLFTLKKELTIYAQIPDDEMKHALKMYSDTALLVIELLLLNSEHKPVGLGITYYRGDYIKILGFSD